MAVRKVVPEVLDLLVTPFVTLFVMSILGLFVIGQSSTLLNSYILVATETLLALPFGLPGLIIGGVHKSSSSIRCSAPYANLLSHGGS